jgi:hypothetical protein
MEVISSDCASIRKESQLLNILMTPNGLGQRFASKRIVAYFRSSKNEHK